MLIIAIPDEIVQPFEYADLSTVNMLKIIKCQADILRPYSQIPTVNWVVEMESFRRKDKVQKPRSQTKKTFVVKSVTQASKELEDLLNLVNPVNAPPDPPNVSTLDSAISMHLVNPPPDPPSNLPTSLSNVPHSSHVPVTKRTRLTIPEKFKFLSCVKVKRLRAVAIRHGFQDHSATVTPNLHRKFLVEMLGNAASDDFIELIRNQINEN
jgi:hypothetical protein